MITKENIIIENIGKKSILADVSFYDNTANKPVVVFCHGYKGFKDWGAWNLVADLFAKEGFVFFKFNFSHNGGTIENPIDFPDEEAFAKNTYSMELDDLDRVVSFVENKFQLSPIYLIGHSRGGGIAILKAGQDSRIAKLATWAAVSDFKSRFPKGIDLERWETEGVMYVKNGRTKQHLPHFYSFYKDFVENEDNLNIPKWCSKIDVPYLIIHGTKDEAVSMREATMLSVWNPKSQTCFLETNHTFDTKHPWNIELLSESMKKVSSETIGFFRGS